MGREEENEGERKKRKWSQCCSAFKHKIDFTFSLCVTFITSKLILVSEA